MTHLPRKVTSPEPNKRLRIRHLSDSLTLSLEHLLLSTFSLVFVTLANDDHNVRRATVPYAPLYPTFQESLNRFRRGEHSELIQRGAERVVHNVGVYDTRRSSEDGSVNLVVIHPADIPSAGPQEQSIDNEAQPILPIGYEGPLNQPEGDMVSEHLSLVGSDRKYQQRKTFFVYRARAKHGANCSLNTPVAT